MSHPCPKVLCPRASCAQKPTGGPRGRTTGANVCSGALRTDPEGAPMAQCQVRARAPPATRWAVATTRKQLTRAQ
eukprot:5686351-Alexandrium_andersonii.AAC.1